MARVSWNFGWQFPLCDVLVIALLPGAVGRDLALQGGARGPAGAGLRCRDGTASPPRACRRRTTSHAIWPPCQRLTLAATSHLQPQRRRGVGTEEVAVADVAPHHGRAAVPRLAHDVTFLGAAGRAAAQTQGRGARQQFETISADQAVRSPLRPRVSALCRSVGVHAIASAAL